MERPRTAPSATVAAVWGYVVRAPTARQRAETDRLHAQVDYVHRYWKREMGSYPRAEESMSVVIVIAAMNEMAALPCQRPAS